MPVALPPFKIDPVTLLPVWADGKIPEHPTDADGNPIVAPPVYIPPLPAPPNEPNSNPGIDPLLRISDLEARIKELENIVNRLQAS